MSQQKWENTVIELPKNPWRYVEEANKLGKEGWELAGITIIEGVLVGYFKRPIIEHISDPNLLPNT